MSLKDVQESFKELQEVLQENLHREKKDLWQVHYAYWRFYRSMNLLLDHAETLKDQQRILDQIFAVAESLSQHAEAVVEKYTPLFGKEALYQEPSKTRSPSLQGANALLHEERARLEQRIKEIKGKNQSNRLRKNRLKSQRNWA